MLATSTASTPNLEAIVSAIDWHEPVENLGAVYIFIWIVFQQVTIRVDAELLAQYLFLLGSYPRQEHDVLV